VEELDAIHVPDVAEEGFAWLEADVAMAIVFEALKEGIEFL
jgi:hypothetical protein